MHKAIFEIYHKGCWGSDIGVKFPHHSHSSIDVRWINNSVAHIVKSLGDKNEFSKIVDYLKNQSDVTSAEVLSESENEVYIRTLTKSNPDHPSFSHKFFENNCFTISPTKFKDKYEVWTLGSSSRKNLTKAYDLVKEMYEVRIKYLAKDTIEADLTQKQRNVFMYAKYFGYYNWPRKKTATQIAKLINVPKTVFLSHLRKAENKILNNYSK